MDKIDTASTSRQTATATPIVLRENAVTRLVFAPLLIEGNPKDPAASVEGSFIFQRRSPGGSWKDEESFSLSQLKSGEGYKLRLNSIETKQLFDSLVTYYSLVDQHGVVSGKQTFIADPGQQITDLFSHKVLGSLSNLQKLQLFRGFEEWLAGVDRQDLVAELAKSDFDFRSFDSVVGAARLRRLIDQVQEGRRSQADNEEFWQQLFESDPWALTQIAAAPLVIINGQAYVGGKGVDNRGGNVADLLCKNAITSNATLVEIKTPGTKLVGRPYRNNAHAPTPDFSGAVVQLLVQQQSLVEEISSLSKGEPWNAIAPRGVLLIGDVESEKLVGEELASFEIYRNSLQGITVVTFDEVALRLERQFSLLCP